MSSVPRPDDFRPTPHDETIANSNAGSGSASASSGSLHARPQEPATSANTVEEFSHNVTASGLMTAEELQLFCQAAPARDALRDASAFAELLIQANKLTPYQVETLRQGHTRGLVLGNYVVLEKLGEGGMGLVFKARHRLMKRIVALKVLPPSLTLSADSVNRFHREVEVAARLAHPNIAAAHDADQADDIHFLVMEYVEGPNLSALVKQGGVLSVPVAMNIVAQAARGLAHAHAHGVVHRDIKPSNLLVSPEGIVKILDMGLAQLESSERNNGDKADLTQSGRIMGTVDYMAPEQALDARSVDQRADIYSLGCTLYYLLAGHPLAPEGTLTQKLLWHQTEPVPALRDAAPEAPESLELLFQKMVAKKPEDRLANMEEVVAALEPLLENVPPEQLQLPTTGVELSTGAGSSTDHGLQPGRVTMVDRPTLIDAGDSEPASPAPAPMPVAMPPVPVPRSRAGLLLPLGAVLGLLGVAAGISLFLFLAPPATISGHGGGSGKKDLPIVAGEEATLIIDASQPGARVLLNGEERGRTTAAVPYQLELTVPPGAYEVRVEKEGFDPYSDKVALKAGTPLTLATPLGIKPAIVAISVEIPGVQVSVDGRLQGTPAGMGPHELPLTLEAGEHLLRYEAPGYEAKEEKLTVKSGEKFEHSVALMERPFRALLTLIFRAAHPDVMTPVILVDPQGQSHSPKRWSEVPPQYTEVRHIDLSRALVRNEELQVFPRAETLDSLSLAHTPLDDSGMSELGKLESLTRLDLSETAITDKGASSLARLARLRDLDLSGTKITDAALDSLLALPLEHLHLSRTAVSDAGVKKLIAVQTLKTLAVDGTHVTEEGFQALGKAFAKNPIDKQDLDPELNLARKLLRSGAALAIVPATASADVSPKQVEDPLDLPVDRFKIVGIDARGSRAVDDGLLRELASLSRLTSIDLDGTTVTEAGLADLRKIPTLTNIELGYLRVSKTSVEALRQALDKADVVWHGPRDRVAAEWVFEQGGAVRMAADGSRVAKQWADLPENRDFRLEEVHLINQADLPAEQFAVLRDLADLRVLNLAGSRVTAAALTEITGCPEVTTLAVSGSKVDNDAVAVIVERFPNLERLYLADTAIDGASLLALKKLPNLTHLSLAGTRIADSDVETLAGFSKLSWLSLDGTPLTDAALPTLERLTQLKVLSLNDEQLKETERMLPREALPETPERSALQITDAGIEELRGALRGATVSARALDPQRLTARWVLAQGGAVVTVVDGKQSQRIHKSDELPRQACQVVEISLRNLPGLPLEALGPKLRACPQLRWLDLSGNAAISDKHLAALGALPALEALDLTKTSVTDSLFARLGALEKLRMLGLEGTMIDGSGLLEHPLPKLTHLYAGTTDFTDRTLAGLRPCKQLTVLDLHNCRKITDRGVAELAGLTKLERLNLSLTPVTELSAPTIGKLKHLKSLNLHGVPAGDGIVSQLAGLDQLVEINLANTRVSDGALAQLSAVKSLERISIYGTSVTDAGAAPLRARGVDVDKTADPVERDANSVGSGFGS